MEINTPENIELMKQAFKSHYVVWKLHNAEVLLQLYPHRLNRTM